MLSSKRKTELDTFLKSINFEFDDYQTLHIALTHSSYTHENNLSTSLNNERLEFLGDAVLKLISSDYLYERFPEYDEGELTKIRSILVSDKTLTGLAQQIDLHKYLELGYHEEKTGGRHRDSTLACAFEAILGAFYVGGKYKEIKEFLIKLIANEVTLIDKSDSKFNSKAILQEYAQGHSKSLPDYELVSEDGPPHNKIFKVSVSVEGEYLGTGSGKTKKAAQQAAAQEAVKNLNLVEN